MLPVPQRRGYHRMRHRGHLPAPPLGGADGGPGLQRGPDVAEGDPPWIRDKVEALQQHGTNVLRFHVALGVRHWFIIVCYLSPNDAVTIE